MTENSAPDGQIVGIFISGAAGAAMQSLDQVRAIAGAGLEGDRYEAGEGFMSARRGGGLELTLVEAEALAELSLENGVEITAVDSRRNLATRGVRLNDLVDREVQIGNVTIRGVRLCEPCARIEKLVGKPFVKPMLHRAGLRADIIQSGTIRVGDQLALLDESSHSEPPPEGQDAAG